MKKLLVAACVAGLVAGCGKKEEAPAPQAAAPAPEIGRAHV